VVVEFLASFVIFTKLKLQNISGTHAATMWQKLAADFLSLGFFSFGINCFGINSFGISQTNDLKSRLLKGIAYIKFAKTSEAALAMEEMNGKIIAGDPRPLKVLVSVVIKHYFVRP